MKQKTSSENRLHRFARMWMYPYVDVLSIVAYVTDADIAKDARCAWISTCENHSRRSVANGRVDHCGWSSTRSGAVSCCQCSWVSISNIIDRRNVLRITKDRNPFSSLFSGHIRLMVVPQLPISLRQPHSSPSVSDLPVHAPATSSYSLILPLSPSITPSLFRSRLKTYLFHKSFPP